jgi:glycosyltransferase involved in cell wall biosynthesis
MTRSQFATSVLVPVYLNPVSTENVQALRRALASVFDQRFPGPVEVMIIDDGSPVPIAGIPELAALPDEVRWVRCHQNGGVVHALNTGLREARHPYIARLDADDYWGANKIEKQFSQIAMDRDLTIIGTGMTIVDPDGRVIDTTIRPAGWKGIIDFYVNVGCPFPHGSVVARRDIYRLLGGYPHDPRFAHCEDYALWGIWLRFFKPAMIEELLYNYTVSPSSMSVRYRPQQNRATKLVNASFAKLNLADTLPKALRALADVLGISVLQAGVLAYRMWHYQVAVCAPTDAVEPLSVILSDRDVGVVDDGKATARELNDVLVGFLSPEAKFPQYTSQIVARPK